eukprot:Gb_33631 [translate_table: standard]
MYSRSSSQKNMESLVAPDELIPGILDLHAIDTELLSEVFCSSCEVNYGHGMESSHWLPSLIQTSLDIASAPGLFEPTSPFTPVVERGFENDSEGFVSASKQQSNRLRLYSEASPLKAVALERERTIKDNGVAKIKVVMFEIGGCSDYFFSGSSMEIDDIWSEVDLTAYVEKHEFVFDAVLDDHVTNDDVYCVTVEPIVPAIFQRSGKTYTMQPLPLKASQDILGIMQQGYRNQGFQLWVSFFEIYGGKLFDLLNDRRKLFMREDGKQQVCIVGLQEYLASDVETVKEYIERGNATRSTGCTGANEESSRSHAILQLAIKKSPDGNDSKPSRLVGKLSFIDLAGSERGADTTDNDRQTRMEGAEINKSLLALKECIRALDSDQGHIPFRGSKLTEVLRDSFVGDSRTVMISCISPNSGSCEHTLNTLRYADRVKSLSKTNNSRKEPACTPQTLRESSPSPLTLPLSFAMPGSSQPFHENNISDLPSDRNRYGEQSGWNKQLEGEIRTPFSMDQGLLSARDDGGLACSRVYESITCQESQEQEKLVAISSGRKLKSERYRILNPTKEILKTDTTAGVADKRPKDLSTTLYTNLMLKEMDSEVNLSDPNEDFNAILKTVRHSSARALFPKLQEEEELVTAHRKQVEETIDIVREEMKLLSEADQPGNGIDRYMSRLNQILSHKAAGIASLQARLAQFERLLSEQKESPIRQI